MIVCNFLSKRRVVPPNWGMHSLAKKTPRWIPEFVIVVLLGQPCWHEGVQLLSRVMFSRFDCIQWAGFDPEGKPKVVPVCAQRQHSLHHIRQIRAIFCMEWRVLDELTSHKWHRETGHQWYTETGHQWYTETGHQMTCTHRLAINDMCTETHTHNSGARRSYGKHIR